MTKRGGFTYVEVVVLIAVVGLLIILAAFGINQYKENNKTTQTTSKTNSTTSQTTEDTTTTQSTTDATTLGAPMLSITVNSTSQITTNWTPAAHSTPQTTYTLTRATNSDFTANVVTQKGITLTSSVVTGLSAGKTYYFKVQAVSSANTSDFSNVVTNVTSTNTQTVTQNTDTTTTPAATIAAPAAYTLASSNDGQSLTADSSASVCASGTTNYYSWKVNGLPWVEGASYKTVTYSLSYGQGVSLQAATKCVKGSDSSTATASTNTVSYTRQGMNLTLTPGVDDCSGNYCGRVINATWTNVCGTTTPTLKAKQLGTLSSWQADTASADSTKWKGASSPGVKVSYYEVNLGCASAAASINVVSAYKCTGCM